MDKAWHEKWSNWGFFFPTFEKMMLNCSWNASKTMSKKSILTTSKRTGAMSSIGEETRNFGHRKTCVCLVTSVTSASLQPHGLWPSRLLCPWDSLDWVAYPSPGYLLDPEIEPTSPVSPALAGRFYTTAPPGKPLRIRILWIKTVGDQKGLYQISFANM